MKNYKHMIMVALSVAGLSSAQSAMALSDGDALQFISGSSFGMEVAPGFFLSTQLEANDGLIIGREQPATGSHSGSPDGTEDPTIDRPWNFFGNTGMFRTREGSGGVSIIDNDGAGNFELRFNGFGVTWNGIPHIDLSGPSGIASLHCSTAACTIGDEFTLEYSAMVPIGDPSGFGGVRFRLHLEGLVNLAPTNLDLRVNIDGGRTQECRESGGSTVNMSASFYIPTSDALASIDWTSNGTLIGQGASISPFLALGSHNILVTLQTDNGLVDSQMVNLVVRDTTPPDVTAEFIGVVSGEVITQVDRERKISTHIAATDICDPNPVITYSNLKKNEGVAVQDGDVFMTLPNGSTDIHDLQESLRLDVTARDVNNNVATQSAILIVR